MAWVLITDENVDSLIVRDLLVNNFRTGPPFENLAMVITHIFPDEIDSKVFQLEVKIFDRVEQLTRAKLISERWHYWVEI